MVFRGRRVTRDRALVMAIVNRTPDSFYDHGATFAEDAARTAISRAVDEGADMIDLGGVTASPGAEVTADEEIARIVPLVEWARARYPDLLISIDTWRHEVGDATCRAGADIMNDAWAAADPRLIDVAAAYGAGYVCTHTGGRTPRAEPYRPDYPDVVTAVRTEVLALAERAEAAGVPRGGILIDGTGYGKDTADHLTLLGHVKEFTGTGWPVLMALSNKTFVGETLDVGLDERLTGTLAATAIAARDGAAVFRAHQVAPTRETLEMAAAINGTRQPARTSAWIS
ncbi:dihydropteroate synthase [Streptomyces montanisoli]|uniref:Dihydropteroate synthase n=1 Tax=Streptomyces montanisoli TaxID=2798581 RepID=A0A940MGK2_9ACTN|nr:dihydropteroate synthase [Streptomyces montanisoli]MBP0459911.1 dihydropteroate synthase [Streptomyces montanisoli]